MIEPVAPTEAIESAATFLEERHDLGKRVERLHAIARVPAPARVRPAGVALLAAGAGGDDLGLALGPAAAADGDIKRERYFMKCRHESLAALLVCDSRAGRGFVEGGHCLASYAISSLLPAVFFPLPGQKKNGFEIKP